MEVQEVGYNNEKFKFRKETTGWIVWNCKQHFYFWYPYEEVSKDILKMIISSNYHMDNAIYSNFRLRLNYPLRVYYDITYDCNMNCEYCYNKEVKNEVSEKFELTINEKKTMVDLLSSKGIYKLSVAGGEPLLCEDLYEISSYAKSKDMTISITTNGTLLNKSTFQKLSNFDGISVSLDSVLSESYRKSRYDSQYIISNINSMPEGLKAITSIKMVVDILEDNHFHKVIEILDFMLISNLKSLKISILLNDRISNNTMLNNKYYTFIKNLIEVQKKYNEIKITCNSSPILNNYGLANVIFGSSCGAGKDLMVITPYGDCKSCLMLDNTNCVGSIKSDKIEYIWSKLKPFNICEECESCDLLGVCFGGCGVRKKMGDKLKDPLCVKDSFIYSEIRKKNMSSLKYCFTHS